MGAALWSAALFATSGQNLVLDGDIDQSPLSPEFRLVEGVKRGTLEQVTEDLTWNKALKMTLTGIETNGTGRLSANVCLMAGGKGSNGFPVKAGAKYAFSFEAKGAAPRLLVVWRERDAAGKVRKIRTDMHVIKLTADWVAYRGTVEASADAVEGGLVLQFWGNDGHHANWGNKPGDWVLIDKIAIRELPKVRDIWSKPEKPYALAQVPQHIETTIPFRPDELAGTDAVLRVRAAVNEHAVIPVALGNLTDSPENYRLSLNDGFYQPAAQYEHAMMKPFLPGHVTLRRGVAMRDSDAEKHGAFLDVLEKLGEAGVLPVPAKEAGLVWIQIDCRGLKPGLYRGNLQVTRLTGGRGIVKARQRRAPGASNRTPFVGVEIDDGSTAFHPIEVEILPIELDPADMVMVGFMSVFSDYESAFCNDYDLVMQQICPYFFDAKFDAHGALIEEMPRSFLLPHLRHINATVRRIGNFPRVMVAHSAYEVFKRVHWPRKLIAFDSPEYWRAFGEWISYVDRTMRANGFENDDYVTQLFDEPNPKLVSPDELMKAYAETKRCVPKMKLLQTNGEGLYFDKLFPYADYWFFSQHVFGQGWSRQCAERFVAAGKVTAMYACGTEMRQSLYRYYRLLSWKSASFGGRITPLYEIYDRIPAIDFRGATKGGVSYNTGSAVVPTIRLENLRNGMTDIRYLRVLERLIAQKGTDPLAAEALRYLKAEMKDVVEIKPHETGRADIVRAQIVDYILRLAHPSK